MPKPFVKTDPLKFFNEIVAPFLSGGGVPIARNSDPISALEAGEELTKSDKRKAQMDRIIIQLRAHAGSTAHELKRGLPGLNEVQICKRLNDLRGAGMAEKVGIRPCRVTKRRLQTWRAI